MPSWTVFAFFLAAWLAGVILGGIIEGTTPGAEHTSVLQTLISFDMFEWRWTMGIPHPWFDTEWLRSVYKSLTWDFALFNNTWGTWIRGFMLCASAGVAMKVLYQLMRLIRGGG